MPKDVESLLAGVQDTSTPVGVAVVTTIKRLDSKRLKKDQQFQYKWLR